MHYPSLSHGNRRVIIAAGLFLIVAAGLWWMGILRFPSVPFATRPVAVETPLGRIEGSGLIGNRQNGGESGAASVDDRVTRDSGSSTNSPGPVDPQNLRPTAQGSGGAQAGESIRAQAANGKSIAEILKDADMSQSDVRARVVAEMRLLEERQHQAVMAKARQLGTPLRIDGPGHKVSTLYDFHGDEPVYRTTLNANAAISSAANLVAPAPYSLDGTGVKVGVWDGGSVRETHQELTGRVIKKDSSSAVDDHATHVAGTIGASGVQANAKGMAPAVSIDSYEWTDDYAEMTAAGTVSAGDASGIPLSNHSYGLDAVTADMGRYETEANSVDAIAAVLPYYLPFWAAGNEQDVLTAKGGFQSITFNGLAKNVMTIGAVDDAVTSGTRAPAKGLIAYFSSLGPCDDGRIKPDLVANGVDLYSSVATSNTAYDGTYSGTSMATPSALGSSALLVQLYAREFSGQRMRASTLKALLIHTADDIGTSGPDYKYGWGLINVKAASDLIIAHKGSLAAPMIIDGALTNSAKANTHTFTWDGFSPIRATVCWTDPAGTVQTTADSRIANLKHNLDAKITAPNGSTVYQPFVMPFVGAWTTATMSSAATTGKNNVDNVEQVYLAAPSQAGVYTVTVSLDGTLTTTSQAYSLIVSGGAKVASNPPPNVALTSPADGASFLPGAVVAISATASDVALGGGLGVVSQVEFYEGSSLLGVDTSPPYSLNWNSASSGTHTITAKAMDSEGATATSNAATITVLTGNGIPSVSSFTPTRGASGSLVVLSGFNFVSVSAVRFNGVEATYTVDSAGQITATVPVLATTGTITVVNSYGTGTSIDTFTLLEPPVLVSQIYGGGGNSGAIYNRDYIELYNRSSSAVSLTGWSLQYSSSSGTTWSVIPLSGSMAPGKYCLVGLGSGSSGLALPAVDVSGSINMGASNGKVALMNTITALSGSSPLGKTGLQDLVGYGTANAYEGAAIVGSSTTKAIFRVGAGTVDTGNNDSDFTVGYPNPRNSATGPLMAPVITSANAATGALGSAFSYQITASNTPSSFAATGLPAGLSVSSATGSITGTPTIVGSYSVTISATNSTGTGSSMLTLTVGPASGGGTGDTILLSENFAALTSGDNVTTIGSSVSWIGNTNFLSAAAAYQAGGTVKLGSGSGIGSLTSKALDLSGNGGSFRVSFKVKGWTTVEGSIKVTVTGLPSQTISYNSVMADSFETKLLNFTSGAVNSTVKFETTAKRAFLDDIVVSYSPVAATPVITVGGTLSSVDTVYGTASPNPTRFSVSGVNISSGILVTPPPGFEVSQTSAASGYALTQTIGGTGTVAATEVYGRLAAGTSAGSYSGNIVCSATGAVAGTISTAPSEVRIKLLTITATNQTKLFGVVMNLGSGQSAFTSSGLVGADTIDSVTLTASGGAAMHELPGIYSLTPSAALGGNLNFNNYDCSYIDGSLTVMALSFSEWLAHYSGISDPRPAGDPDSDGVSNLMEYFTGSSPVTANVNAGVSFTTDANRLFMTYRKAKGIAGTIGTVEWSGDLSAGVWSTSGVVETSRDLGSYEEKTASVGKTPEDSKKFMRLRIQQP